MKFASIGISSTLAINSFFVINLFAPCRLRQFSLLAKYELIDSTSTFYYYKGEKGPVERRFPVFGSKFTIKRNLSPYKELNKTNW